MENLQVPVGIIRHEYQGYNGWYLQIKRNRKKFQKRFSDKEYGGIEQSLDAARKYLEHLNELYPKAKNNVFQKDKDGNIKGVWKQKGTTKGYTYYYWYAEWCPEPGVVKKKSFSINKYGDSGARKLAIKARIDGIESIKETNPDSYNEQIKEIPIKYLNKGIFGTDKRKRNYKKVNYKHYSYEGNVKYDIHKKIERNTRLRKLKIQLFLEKHGSLFCQLCEFNFIDKYPWIDKDIIEVHHIVPLAELKKRQKVTPDDLVLLCPNCHTAIHQGDAQDNLIEAAIYFDKDII